MSPQPFVPLMSTQHLLGKGDMVGSFKDARFGVRLVQLEVRQARIVFVIATPLPGYFVVCEET